MSISSVQARISAIEAKVAALSQGMGRGESTTGTGPGIDGVSLLRASSFSDAYSTAAAQLDAVAPADPGGRVSPPAALAAYGNGHIPAEALAPIGIGAHRLWAPAASAFQAMRDDAARAGVSIGVTDSYRPYDEQVDLAKRKGLYRDGGLAAVPGTSAHGWGLALDVDVDDAGLAWLRSNAGRYGFAETTPREPWHWEYRAGA